MPIKKRLVREGGMTQVGHAEKATEALDEEMQFDIVLMHGLA